MIFISKNEKALNSSPMVYQNGYSGINMLKCQLFSLCQNVLTQYLGQFFSDSKCPKSKKSHFKPTGYGYTLHSHIYT